MRAWLKLNSSYKKECVDLGEPDKEDYARPYRLSCINGFQYNLSILYLLRTTAASVNKSDFSFCFGGDFVIYLMLKQNCQETLKHLYLVKTIHFVLSMSDTAVCNAYLDICFEQNKHNSPTTSRRSCPICSW